MPADAERLPSVGAIRQGWGLWLWPLAVVIVVGVLPTASFLVTASRYDYPFASRIYTTAVRQNPAVLVFPILAALPYVSSFSTLVQDRYLAQARTRAPLARMLAAHAFACCGVTAACFFVVGMCPALSLLWRNSLVDPSSLSALSPAQFELAEMNDVPMAGLARWGVWVLPVVYSAWLALNAVLYALMSWLLILLQPNRLIALAAPWLAWTLAATVMASARWEVFSPDLVMPFNLAQVAPWQFGASLLFPIGLLAILAAVVWLRRQSLHGCL